MNNDDCFFTVERYLSNKIQRIAKKAIDDFCNKVGKDKVVNIEVKEAIYTHEPSIVVTYMKSK